jgi:DNA invertase Pin-like site-specific DNA recombinase
MLFGYARVSTDEQNLDLQRAALKAAGCAKIFGDRITGTAQKRPGLARALKACAAGDVLIVWRLDRLGRSLAHLIEFLSGLAGRGVQFGSLSEQLDTTTADREANLSRDRRIGRVRARHHHRAYQRRVEGGEGAQRAARLQAVADAAEGEGFLRQAGNKPSAGRRGNSTGAVAAQAAGCV